MPVCPKCKGTKEQQITIHSQGKVSKMMLDCVHCNGTGEVSARELKQIQAEDDMWCKCGADFSNSYYVPDTRQMKHHYRCGSCHKVTQIG